MRLATHSTRWLIGALLITLPWLSLGAVTNVDHTANAPVPCLQMEAAHPAPGCPQGDPVACAGHCTLAHADVGLLTELITLIHSPSFAPRPAHEVRWPQRHTPPPLRPPRIRLT